MQTATSCNDSRSSVVHHFEANFELSGFGSPGEALVQTVKELVDNALDACRCRSSHRTSEDGHGHEDDAPTVRVVLRRRGNNKNKAKTDVDAQESMEREADEPLELQVADNGDGLNDVTKALVLFSSSKSGHGRGRGAVITPDTASTVGEKKNKKKRKKPRHEEDQNAGKYGLGLTLSLLYSQKHFRGFLKATTARRDSPEWTFTKCDIDLETGLPRTLYSKSGLKPESWSPGCGTDMRLLVPGGKDALAFAEPRLKALFGRMHLLPDRAAGVSFVCEGCLDDTSIVVPRGGKEASYHLLLGNDDLVRAFAKGLTAMARAMARGYNGVGTTEADGAHCGASSSSSSSSSASASASASASSSAPNEGSSQSLSRSLSHGVGVVESPSPSPSPSPSGPIPARRVGSTSADSSFAAEDVAVFECQGSTEAANTSWVTSGVAVERMRPLQSRHEQSASGSGSGSGSGERTVPLFVHRFANGAPMVDTNTSAACALVAGATSKATWANLGLKISSSPSRAQRRDGRLRFVLSEAPTPLKVNGGEDWSALSDVKSVHVAVAANSEVIPYTSLRKDAIAHREGYVSATESAVRQGLESLCRRELGGFRSAFEAANHLLHQELIPLAASGVASMVSHSVDVSFQKKCLHALGVGNEYQYVQERRLCDLLQSELSENVRQEEARRVAAKARAMELSREEAENKREQKRGGSNKK